MYQNEPKEPDGRRNSPRALVAIDFEQDTPALQDDMVRNIAFAEEQARLLLAQ